MTSKHVYNKKESGACDWKLYDNFNCMTKPKTGQGGGQMNEPKPTLGRIVSFQPKPDVRKLLEDAKAAGLDITEILNAALLEKGPIVARKMAEDQKGRIEAFLKEKGGPTR